jgi:L-threonylcarbamoyladenylate synthase
VKTEILPALSAAERAHAVTRAVKQLAAGELVALPTETVYGLAADALKVRAVLKIFAAKERPRFDPLIVHLPGQEWLAEVARVQGAATFIVQRLVGEFWPGPLTLVLPRRGLVPDVVTAGLRTVAVRMSANEIFGEIIRNFGGPLAAPSGNRFGRISPTSADDVREELDRRIPLIIDGGRTTLGIESTVVAVAAGEIEILRRGPISAEQLARIAPVTFRESSGRPKSPGQLASHYAPRTPLRLVRRADALKLPKNVRYGLLSWGARETNGFAEVRRLSRKQDLTEAAANLFHLLRDLDSCELDLIVAEQVPDEGIGSAIMDRLRRAATRLSF